MVKIQYWPRDAALRAIGGLLPVANYCNMCGQLLQGMHRDAGGRKAHSSRLKQVLLDFTDRARPFRRSHHSRGTET